MSIGINLTDAWSVHQFRSKLHAKSVMKMFFLKIISLRGDIALAHLHQRARSCSAVREKAILNPVSIADD